jgi:superfamily II DNA or RNA helicase
MKIELNTKSIDDYRTFLKIKQLPAWSIKGTTAYIPDEYAQHLGSSAAINSSGYTPEPWLYDYQAAIAAMAVKKRKFAVFADCGLGKTLILLSYARHVREQTKGRILIVTPKLVIPQMIEEAIRFWGDDYPVEQVSASKLSEWICGDDQTIGITNYEALRDDTPSGNLDCLILDESSVLKSHYGNWASTCLRLGRGLKWKLALTGTPAPNDRIEYANHAVFLDRFPTVNSFLATYFINRGQTGERWELKPHAIKPFYRSLSAWSIFVSNPAVYGWKDQTDPLPPIHTHIHSVPLTKQQREWVHTQLGSLVATRAGGITMRASYGQVSKGEYKGQTFDTNKYEFMRELVESWQDNESTLVWCIYDHEQSKCHLALGGESMDGKTSDNRRAEMIARFKSRESGVLISKPRILGFGLNLQVATRQIFSGLQDSYESFYQAVKRSNRIGSLHPLNVHIPVTELEEPMVENVLRKASRVESDTKEQEELFAKNKV